MADVSNLKINERSNVERPYLWVTKIENENWENWYVYIYWGANMRIGEISSSAEYWMDEQLQNLPIFRAQFWFSELNFFYKFVNFVNCKILAIT